MLKLGHPDLLSKLSTNMAVREVRTINLEETSQFTDCMKIDMITCNIQQRQICSSHHDTDSTDTRFSQSAKLQCKPEKIIEDIITELIMQVCYQHIDSASENVSSDFEIKSDDKVCASFFCKKLSLEDEDVKQIVFDIVNHCCEELDQNKVIDENHECSNNFPSKLNSSSYVDKVSDSTQSLMNSCREGKSVDDENCIQFIIDSDGHKNSDENIRENTDDDTHQQKDLNQLDVGRCYLTLQEFTPPKGMKPSLIDISIPVCKNDTRYITHINTNLEVQKDKALDQININASENEKNDENDSDICAVNFQRDILTSPDTHNRASKTSGNECEMSNKKDIEMQMQVLYNNYKDSIQTNNDTISKVEIARMFCVDGESLKSLQGKEEIIDTQILSIKSEEDINIGTAHSHSSKHIDSSCCAIGKCETEIDFTLDQMDNAQVAGETEFADKGNYAEVDEVNFKVEGTHEENTCISQSMSFCIIPSPLPTSDNTNDVKSDISPLIEIENRKRNVPAENKFEPTSLMIIETCNSQQVKKQDIYADVSTVSASIASDKLTVSTNNDLLEGNVDTRKVEGVKADSAHNFTDEDISSLNKVPQENSIRINVDTENRFCSAQQHGYHEVADVSVSNEFLHSNQAECIEQDNSSLSSIVQQENTRKIKFISTEKTAEGIITEKHKNENSSKRATMKQEITESEGNFFQCEDQLVNNDRKLDLEMTDLQNINKNGAIQITPMVDLRDDLNANILTSATEITDCSKENLHTTTAELYNDSSLYHNECMDTPINSTFISAMEFHSSQSSESSTSACSQEFSKNRPRKRKFVSEEVNEMDKSELHTKETYSEKFSSQVETSNHSKVTNADNAVGLSDQMVPTGEDTDGNIHVTTDSLFQTSVTPVFKWKYAPSFDIDQPDASILGKGKISDEDAENLSNINPLPQCRRHIRVGLSKKQRLRSLHGRIQLWSTKDKVDT